MYLVFFVVHNQAFELFEKILGIVRTGTRLGVVLHRERRKRLMADAFDRSVVEIDVSHLKAVWNGLRDDGEVVVLARDFHLARGKVLHRMVAAVVPELETHGLCAAGKREQLVPKADAHDGKFMSW